MKKNDPLLIAGGLSVLLILFRAVQLFLINDSGLVDPWWMILPVYLVLAVLALLAFVLVRNDKSEKYAERSFFSFKIEVVILVFSLLLLCEGLSSLLSHLAWDAITIASISVINAFILFAISFILHRTNLKKIAQITAFLGFIEIIVYLVCCSIEIFTANSTSLSFNLNLLSLICFASELFFFKALARDFTGVGTGRSAVSLKRSAFILAGILPAEIIGQVLTHTGLLSEFPSAPFRSSFIEILVSVCLLVMAGFVLTAKEKQIEEITEDIQTNE